MSNPNSYVMVTPFFPSPENWSGAYCYDFVRALMRTGAYDVHVFVPGKGDDYEMDGVVVHRFRTIELPSGILPFLFRRHNERMFLQAVSRAGIDVGQVAVCHGHTVRFAIYALAIKRLNPNCLTLLHHHDLQSFGLNMGRFCHCWLYNLWLYPILLRLHEAIDCHVFISEASRRSFLAVPNTSWTDYAYYKRQYVGLGFYRSPRIKKSIVLNNGVDTSVFMPKSNNQTIKQSNNVFTIGCVANFEVLKDQELVIRAVGLFRKELSDENSRPDIKVIFVGSGPMLKLCRRVAEEVGEEEGEEEGMLFEFRTEVPHAQLADFYRSLDLFVLPSYFEGFGCVYTESAACGVPFIGVKGQGIADVVSDDWLIAPHDLDGLVALIRRVYRGGWKQGLSAPIDVDTLVSDFVSKIENVRRKSLGGLGPTLAHQSDALLLEDV